MFRDATGKVSMMRVGFFACLLVGTISCLAGVVGAFFHVPETGVMISNGSLLMGGTSFAKAIQSKWEAKDV